MSEFKFSIGGEECPSDGHYWRNDPMKSDVAPDGGAGEAAEFVKYIGLYAGDDIEEYGEQISEKWARCCTVLDNLISFDGSGEIDGVSLTNILESVGINEGKKQIINSVEERQKRTGKPLTKRELENILFATVQELPAFPLEQIFNEAINSEYQHQTVMVVGLLGRGKSALSQFLCKGTHDSDDKSSFVSDDMGTEGGGVTTDFWVGHFPFLGHQGNKMITVIDTPGGNDEKLPNFENFRRLQYLMRKIRYINLILLVVSAQDIMRRTESLNTYLQEFALMMQQDNLSANVAVVISRGHIIPSFYNTEERFQAALEESIMGPLADAFGDKCPCYRLSLAKVDYQRNPELETATLETAEEIYDSFVNVPPLDCQKMVSLETRIKLLIQDHVKLEELNQKTTGRLNEEIANHKGTQIVLDDTTDKLNMTRKELEETSDKLGHTEEDLDRWREKHSQCFKLLEKENEDHRDTRTKLDKERSELRETQQKWEEEVKHHHETQERLEEELRNHKETKHTLEKEQEELKKTKADHEQLSEKTTSLEEQLARDQAELEKASKERDKLREKLDKKKGFGCVIS